MKAIFLIFAVLSLIPAQTNAQSASPEALKRYAESFAEQGAAALKKAGKGRIKLAGKPPEKKNPVVDEGPEAALRFERGYRGTANPHPTGDGSLDDKDDNAYPQAQGIALEGLRNVVPMTHEMWTPSQLAQDFLKHKTPEQRAILVFLKTDYCRTNHYRLCSVTTAALEKRSTPWLRQFRIYGAWIDPGNDQLDPKESAWQKSLIDAYKFEQGPGARVVAFLPGAQHGYWSNALGLELDAVSFEKNGGHTPTLERFLYRVLAGGDTESDVAPEVALRDLTTGQLVRLESFLGKPVLLDFWASWCGYCQESTPGIIALHQKYASQGLVVLGIDMHSDDPEDAKRSIAENHIPYPMLRDADGEAAHSYDDVSTLPTTVLIGADGSFISEDSGYSPRAMKELETEVQEALKEMASHKP